MGKELAVLGFGSETKLKLLKDSHFYVPDLRSIGRLRPRVPARHRARDPLADALEGLDRRSATTIANLRRMFDRRTALLVARPEPLLGILARSRPACPAHGRPIK